MSDFGVQLREKQKVRRIYSVLERQFRRYFDEAESRPGVTGENLLRLLETRLDNVVFRMGFATSRAQARQLVNHGHFRSTAARRTWPAIARSRPGTASRSARRAEPPPPSRPRARRSGPPSVPEWLSVEPDKLAGSVTALPRRDQMPAELNEQLVVEYYSR